MNGVYKRQIHMLFALLTTFRGGHPQNLAEEVFDFSAGPRMWTGIFNILIFLLLVLPIQPQKI
jgi:hypothetical protein